MTRIKPKLIIPTLKSLDDVDNALAEIAANNRRIKASEGEMNAMIDDLKATAAQECAPLQHTVAVLEQAVLLYANTHKADLFSQRKSLGLKFGVIGMRASSKLKTLAKHTWERVLKTLIDRGENDYIRVKKDVDKEALRGLSPEALNSLGLKIVQEEVFYYECSEQELPTTSIATGV